MLDALKRLQDIVKANGRIDAADPSVVALAVHVPLAAYNALANQIDVADTANDPANAAQLVLLIAAFNHVNVNDVNLRNLVSAIETAGGNADEVNAVSIHAMSNAAANLTATDVNTTAMLEALTADQVLQIVALGNAAIVQLVKNLGDNVKNLPDGVFNGITVAQLQAINADPAAALAFAKGLGAKVAQITTGGTPAEVANILSNAAVNLTATDVNTTAMLGALTIAQVAAINGLNNAKKLQILKNIGANAQHLPGTITPNLLTLLFTQGNALSDTASISCVASITNTNIQAIAAGDFINFVGNLGGNLSRLAQTAVEAITVDQIKAIPSKQFNDFIKNLGVNLQHLSDDAVQAISVEQLGAIKKSEKITFVNNLGAKILNLKVATNEAFASIISEIKFTNPPMTNVEAVVEAIRPDQIEAISVDKFNNFIKNLGVNLEHLSVDAFKAISVAKLDAIQESGTTKDFIKNLGTKIQNLNHSSTVAKMLCAKDVDLSDVASQGLIAAITVDQIKAIPAEQFDGFITNLGANLASLSDDAVGAIKSSQISAISTPALKMEFVKNLGAKIISLGDSGNKGLVNLLSSEDVNLVGNPALGLITKQQINAVFAYGVSVERRNQFVQNIGDVANLTNASAAAQDSVRILKNIDALTPKPQFVAASGYKARRNLRAQQNQFAKNPFVNQDQLPAHDKKDLIDAFGARAKDIDQNPTNVRSFARLISSPGVDLTTATSEGTIGAITEIQIATIPPERFGNFLTNLGDNFKKLSSDALKAITPQQASALKSVDLDKVGRLDPGIFLELAQKKVNYEVALAGLSADVSEVAINPDDSDQVDITFKTQEEARAFASLFMGDSFLAVNGVVTIDRGKLNENLQLARDVDKRKMGQKTLELKVAMADQKRSTLGTIARIPTTIPALVPLVIGSVVAGLHNAGVKHLPFIGHALSVFAGACLKTSEQMDAGLFLKASRNLRNNVFINQKEAQTPENKGGFFGGLAKFNRICAVPLGAVTQTARIPLKFIGEACKGLDRLTTNSKLGFISKAAIRLIVSPITITGFGLSLVADALDNQSVGRSNVVRRFDHSINTAFRAGADIPKTSSQAGMKRLAGCSDALLEKKNPEFKDFKEGTFVAVSEREFDHGMKAKKYEGWDDKGNFKTVFKFVNPQGRHFDVGDKDLSEGLRDITQESLESVAQQDGGFKEIEASTSKTRSSGMSISEFQEFLSCDGNKVFVDKLQDAAGIKLINVKGDQKKQSGELVVKGYTIKFDQNNVSFFKGISGGAQTRVVPSEGEVDLNLLKIVNQVMTNKMSKSDIKPSPTITNAAAQKLSGSAFGLYSASHD